MTDYWPESAKNHHHFYCKLLGMLNTNYFCTLPNLALQTESLEQIWDRKSLIWDRKFPIPLSSHFWHIIDRWKFWNIFLMFFITQLCFSIVCEGFGWKISKSMFLNCDVWTYPFKGDGHWYSVTVFDIYIMVNTKVVQKTKSSN